MNFDDYRTECMALRMWQFMPPKLPKRSFWNTLKEYI
jgi:hypothetical protein